MTLHSLLRNVADGLRPDKPEVDPGYEYCHVGHDMGCDTCDAGRNKRRCPLSDDEIIARRVSKELAELADDPVEWAARARGEHAGPICVFRLCYELSLENTGSEEWDWWRVRFERVIHYWLTGDDGKTNWLKAQKDMNVDALDDFEAIVSLGQQAGIIDDACESLQDIDTRREPLLYPRWIVTSEGRVWARPAEVTPTRPTSEWPQPLGRRVDVTQGKGIVKT